ncbi:MAG: outer membrane beta-barrel protein [Pseudobdellovibrionaceae bacterium]
MKHVYAFIFSILSFAPVAFAAGEPIIAIEGGFRQQNGEVDNAKGISPQTGFQFGGTAAFEISGKLYFRTGVLYTQRPLKATNKATDTELEFKMNYFDVPVTALYKINDFAGIYGGLIVATNLEKTWKLGGSSIDAQDVKSPILPFVMGTQFKFHPDMGINLFYEMAGEIAKGLSNYQAVGASLMFTFE